MYLTAGFPPRGGRGGRGASRGNRGAPSNRGGGKDQTPLKFENDFDFESENAKFNREQIEKEFKEKLSISEYSVKSEGCSLQYTLSHQDFCSLPSSSSSTHFDHIMNHIAEVYLSTTQLVRSLVKITAD